MKKLVYVLALFLSVFPLSGQATTGFHRVSQVIARANSGSYAVVVPFATVTVTKTSDGTAAVIYRDALLSSQISPPIVTADMSGNYGYYMSLNTCVTETISAPGMGNIVIPNICSNSGTGLSLETNGTPNGSQSLLNLVAGANVVLSNTGGAVTINASASPGVTSINSVAGAFTFSGAGVSCSSTTCTFSATNPDNLTMNNSGSGAASGATYNGSAAKTLSYNTLGAAGLAASNAFTGATNTFTASDSESAVQIAATASEASAIKITDTTASTVPFSVSDDGIGNGVLALGGLSTAGITLTAGTGQAQFNNVAATTQTFINPSATSAFNAGGLTVDAIHDASTAHQAVAFDQISGFIAPGCTTVSPSTTPAFNFASRCLTLTLSAGNATSSTATGYATGIPYTLFLIQPSGGGSTFVPPTAFKGWPSGINLASGGTTVCALVALSSSALYVTGCNTN